MRDVGFTDAERARIVADALQYTTCWAANCDTLTDSRIGLCRKHLEEVAG